MMHYLKKRMANAPSSFKNPNEALASEGNDNLDTDLYKS